jgi:histidine triad (HIT) family protein
MENCPFCKIISGEIPAKKIYEDEAVIAVLDIYPANPGHVLLLTKAHHGSFTEIPEYDILQIGIISKKIAENLIRLLKPEGVSIFLADGPAAGQRAPHFILHLIPRFPNDNLPLDLRKQDVDANKVFEIIKPALKNLFPEMNYDLETKKQLNDEIQEQTFSKQEEETKEPERQEPKQEKKVNVDEITIEKIKKLFE